MHSADYNVNGQCGGGTPSTYKAGDKVTVHGLDIPNFNVENGQFGVVLESLGNETPLDCGNLFLGKRKGVVVQLLKSQFNSSLLYVREENLRRGHIYSPEELQRQEAARAAAEQARLERQEAEDKANAWCKKHGFEDLHTPKKTFRGATKFPLHTAVKHSFYCSSNLEIIRLMVIAGVHKHVKDSNNKFPSELADDLNGKGYLGNAEMNQILAMLCSKNTCLERGLSKEYGKYHSVSDRLLKTKD